VLQEVVPVWQALVGVHETPAVHPTHAPALQTVFVPHDVPFAATVPVSVQTAVPLVQVVDPT
jgi:hypothetical protein